MRTIRSSTDFKKDFRKLKKQNIKLLNQRFEFVISQLIHDIPLDAKFKDHALIGNWKGFRECHIFPDVLLIYKKCKNEVLLAKIGSHSNLFS